MGLLTVLRARGIGAAIGAGALLAAVAALAWVAHRKRKAWLSACEELITAREELNDTPKLSPRAAKARERYQLAAAREEDALAAERQASATLKAIRERVRDIAPEALEDRAGKVGV